MKATFLRECERIIDPRHVISQDTHLTSYKESISGETRNVPACVRPANVAEVQSIVQLANRYGVPLYPISKGKNWGLGSRLPVSNNTIILDLGRLNKIREINTQFGYAVVEPGVTQVQLYEYFQEKNLPYIFDVVGSASETSILGNVLEGGVGYFGLRFETASGFEVVLGDGSLLRTGYGHFHDSKLTHLYRYGVGPFLDGLFVQSNFGIVTSMGIDLIPKPEAQIAALCSIKNESAFSKFVEGLARLKRTGVVQNNIKIGNKYRSQTTLCPLIHDQLKKTSPSDSNVSRQLVDEIFAKNFGSWSAVFPIMGSKEYVRLTQKEVKAILGNTVELRFISSNKLHFAKKALFFFKSFPHLRYQSAILHAIEPLFDLSRGVPTDATLPSLYWPLGDVPENFRDPDATKSVGMIAYLPIIPLDGASANLVQERVNTVTSDYGFIPNITMTIVSGKGMWGVIDIAFKRDDQRVLKDAKKCISALGKCLLDDGIIPQRVGIDDMAQLVDPKDSYWQTAQKLKSVLDPNGILSPGRYNLLSEQQQ